MKCPRCDVQLYRQVEIEDNLTAVECTTCAGCWINSANYWSWHESYKPEEESIPEEDIMQVPDVKSEKGKICPECKAILIPSKVGHGHDFRVDRCGLCGGFWLDKNEWEALRSTGLHDDIHKIATNVWQNKIRKENIKEIMRNMYEEKFDAETIKKLNEIHNWIHAHYQKDELLSYLLDEDPYEL